MSLHALSVFCVEGITAGDVVGIRQCSPSNYRGDFVQPRINLGFSFNQALTAAVILFLDLIEIALICHVGIDPYPWPTPRAIAALPVLRQLSHRPDRRALLLQLRPDFS